MSYAIAPREGTTSGHTSGKAAGMMPWTRVAPTLPVPSTEVQAGMLGRVIRNTASRHRTGRAGTGLGTLTVAVSAAAEPPVMRAASRFTFRRTFPKPS
ncbi:hypothetical protein ACFY4K_30980 [Streptomyces leeuwenhoekii]|uniref:hypothetical protein n=1 Tax=Streptomyces leeuwenhoekii TaxID=1437453 RepID=UPI0036A866C7